ncbi:hypothetical protein DFH11DRAFT_1559227 [Phellopilus nigrolimitatus]|nr:hypothetical protein DFH11DRAFT_1559227 [Phellopilus nigrolimitatus]
MQRSELLSFKCLVLLLLLLLLSIRSSAFDFAYDAPTQCDNLNISWSGGRGPYSLLITPLFDVPQNVSIPDSALNESSGNGSFSMQLALETGKQFLLTMSDATGFGSGGTSSLLAVGSSISGANCNTTAPSPEFFFQLNTALQQCRSFTFSGYDGATQPVTVLGLIPLGQTFQLHSPSSGPTSFEWEANVAADTSIAFIMIDSEGRQGGSSDLRTVSPSDNSSCINASSPHSTVDTPATQTDTPHTTETVQVKTGPRSGQIAGAAIGGVALLALVLIFVFFCIYRRCRKDPPLDTQHPQAVFIGSRGTSRVSRVRSSLVPSRGRRAHPSVDLLPPSARTPLSSTSHRYSLPLQDDYMPSPFILPSDASAADGHSLQHPSDVYPRDAHSLSLGTHAIGYSPSRSRSNNDGPLSPVSALSNSHSQGHVRMPSSPYSVSSAVLSPKASLARSSRTTPRFVLHTDAEDASVANNNGEVVELPPQYTERRDQSPES